ncbi:MAG: flagellar hook-length control protein FliK, partial [Alphaproteobacteria bacterium]|nr:flagellar hook-length control protein FliK [Alphaproteobacteria bacterium]
KLSQLDQKAPAEKTAILEKLQASAPASDDELLKNLTALLEMPAEAKPSLPVNLSANLSVMLQNDAADEETLVKLQDMFAQNTAEQATPDIEQFRKDAIDMMQGMGLDDASIERMLVKLADQLSPQLQPQQQTALMMPLETDAPADADAPGDSDAPVKTAAVAQDPGKYQPAHKAESPYSPHAAKDSPAPQQAPLPQDTQQAAPKSQQAQTQAPATNLALVNSFASQDSGADGFGGQSGFSQSGANMQGMTAGTAATQTASGTPGSFVNYMNSASSTQTTQMIALQIHRNAQTQVDTFRMQLHPTDMGQLEVRLKVSKDGTMKAHLVADKPETLAILQKDSAQLQKMLEQSGIQLDGNALSFDLRQQRDQGAQSAYNNNGSRAAAGNADDDIAPAAGVQANISAVAMGSISQGGINIMV